MADVSNYIIQNASGANVRIDLNEVFAAIQSSNSKSTDLVTSQCVAGMPFLNTTSNILKIRNSSNNGFTEIGNINSANLGLLPRSGGTSSPMTGQFLADDSNSASSPAISFDTDSDLGLFRKSANIMGFSSGGTEQMLFDANGITLQLQNEIRFADANSSHYVAMRSPSTVSSNVTLMLPATDGSSGQALKTDGSGNLSFGSIASTDVTGALFTLGSTSVSRGNTITALAGMHQIAPASNNNYSLGTTSLRWSNIFTNDLNLSNEGGANDVDGTWGSYTIQEGKDSLFLLNKRNGKKYKFNLTEVT